MTICPLSSVAPCRLKTAISLGALVWMPRNRQVKYSQARASMSQEGRVETDTYAAPSFCIHCFHPPSESYLSHWGWQRRG